MRLVIERDGGFTVVESDDVQDVNVCNDGVDIVGRAGDSVRLEREGHAASVALATAIALRCGELVEPLSEQSEVDTDAAMGAASAALVRERSRPWKATSKAASEWVAGEPPKGGLWYVVARSDAFGCVAWDGLRFRDWYSETALMGGDVAHLPTPVPSRR